jgi:hypothetical protein
MNTSLIRKIIASDLPRKEQDILILLVVDYNNIDQKKRKLDDYYETEQSENESETEESENEQSENETETEKSESDSETTVKPEGGYDCNDHGYNAAVRAQYEARHGRSLCARELDAQEYSEKLVSRDDSKLWGLQFPSHTIWGNWVHSYTK